MTLAPTLLLLRWIASNTVWMRNVVRAKLGRIDIHLVLADEAADAGDFGHARNGIELVADEPILHGRNVARIVWALHGVPEHLADSGGVGPECRDNAGRKKA